MFESWVTAYPWDIFDEGEAGVLDRLQGETGVTGIAVWAACPPVREFRVREIQPRFVSARGGVCFSPTDSYYVSTRCKPIAADTHRGKDALRRIAEACNRWGLALRAIVSASATGQLARRYSEMSAKNAFAAPSEYAVCPAVPDVEAYLVGLVSDLSANYPLAAVVVTDFVIAWLDAYTGERLGPGRWSEAQRRLLSMCFCESCRQKAGAAGIDVESASRAVRSMIQARFDRGPSYDAELERTIFDQNELISYSRWQGGELSALLGRLKEACRCELVWGRAVRHEACKLPANREVINAFAVLTSIDRPEDLPKALLAKALRSEASFSSTFMLGTDSAEIVSIAGEAARLGIAAVSFEHYGALSNGALVTVKQAIRLGRRSNP